jgi:hypothetical protein
MAVSRRSLACLCCAAAAMGWYVWTALATAEGPSRTGTLLVLSTILSVVMSTLTGLAARLPSWAVGVGASGVFLFVRSAVAAEEFSGESPAWLLGQTLLVLAASTVLHHLTASIVITHRQPAQPSSGIDPLEAVRVEISRARRHERPMSVAVLQRTSAGGAVPRQAIDRYVERLEWQDAVTWLMGTCRRPDLVLPHPGAHMLVIVAPETDGAAMATLAGRVRRHFVEAMHGGADVRIGIASFPDDGFSYAALVDAAQRRMPETHEGTRGVPAQPGATIGA